MTAIVAALVLVAGLSIGATSVGGVLVVPVLTGLGHVASHEAVAAASFGFGFAGLAAFAGRGTIAADAPRLGWGGLVSAFSGAALGAYTLAWLPGRTIVQVVGAVALVSGAFALFGVSVRRRRVPGVAGLALLGLVVGCVSSWSGTGGPVVLLPLLALMGWPLGDAVQAAQRIQLPVAAAASVVHATAGRLDLWLGVGLGALLLAGWWAGRWAAARLPVMMLRRCLGVVLMATGLTTLR